MAEAILRHQLEQAGIEGVEVDSAGTGAWHAGESADQRTLTVLKQHGIPHQGRARQLRAEDFTEFDLILTMDSSNRRDTLAWSGSRPEKVRRFLDRDVPDPYSDSSHGFQRVYEMLDEGCRKLIEELKPNEERHL